MQHCKSQLFFTGFPSMFCYFKRYLGLGSRLRKGHSRSSFILGHSCVLSSVLLVTNLLDELTLQLRPKCWSLWNRDCLGCLAIMHPTDSKHKARERLLLVWQLLYCSFLHSLHFWHSLWQETWSQCAKLCGLSKCILANFGDFRGSP